MKWKELYIILVYIRVLDKWYKVEQSRYKLNTDIDNLQRYIKLICTYKKKKKMSLKAWKMLVGCYLDSIICNGRYEVIK